MMREVANLHKFHGKRPLSQWAKDYVREHGLKLSELKYSQKFCSLTRREKDAVRYQLKKNHSVPVKEKGSSKNRQKFAGTVNLQFFLGLWTSLFLMRDLMSFYEFKGYSFWTAFQLAFLVEAAIVFCCVSRTRVLKYCAYALFFYNSLIFSSFVLEGKRMEDSKSLAKLEEKKSILEDKKNIQKQIKDLSNERRSLQVKLDKMVADKWISRGQQVYGPLIKNVEERIFKKEQALVSVKEKILHVELEGQEFGMVSVVLLIFVRLILQFVSLQFFEGFRNRVLGRDFTLQRG